MARPLRIEFEGAWYHVMNRGAGRQVVFRTDDQREYFLALLANTSERFNAEWHAYCLMDNHYHLLVRTPEGNLQRIMRHINGLYTQYYNRMQSSDGPLFRGRYKAILVDAQSYWTQLSRYIHRNPLEAGIVKRLDQYPWSSYSAYIGKAKRPDWLVCDYILKTLANRNVRERYQEYVAEGSTDELIGFYNQKKLSPILGSEKFKKSLGLAEESSDIPELRRVRPRPSASKVRDAICRRLKVEPAAIALSRRGRAADNPARALAMYLCRHESGMTLSEIAVYFGLKSYTSAGSCIRQFGGKLQNDRALRKLINLIKLDLTPS